MSDYEHDGNTVVEDRPEDEVQEPSMYNVIFLNDDYTPMDIVVAILVAVFQKQENEALDLMMQVHTKGRAIVGTYTHDIASTKQAQSLGFAKKQGFPLQVKVEEA